MSHGNGKHASFLSSLPYMHRAFPLAGWFGWLHGQQQQAAGSRWVSKSSLFAPSLRLLWRPPPMEGPLPPFCAYLPACLQTEEGTPQGWWIPHPPVCLFSHALQNLLPVAAWHAWLQQHVLVAACMHIYMPFSSLSHFEDREVGSIMRGQVGASVSLRFRH